MFNNFNKESFSYLEEEDLTFTKEDRINTLNRIEENKHKKKHNNVTLLRISKRYVGPVLGTVMVLIIAIGLLLPNLYPVNEISKENMNKQQAYQNESSSFSALLMEENSTENSNHRSDINILLTYNSGDNSVKLVPIPRDTYVKIFDSEGKMITEDKLMHATASDSTPDPVLKTVSNLFNIPIDYYSVIPEEDMYAELGINKDDEEANNMAINDVGDLIKERLSFSQIKKLLEGSETNIPSNLFDQMEDSNDESIEVVDLEKGIEETFINGIYYVEIDQNLLETTSNTLKKHLGDK